MSTRLYSKRWNWKENRGRKKRQKTFSTEESANKWAEVNEITKYELVNMHPLSIKNKKFRVNVLE
jgi:hypothetical protein